MSDLNRCWLGYPLPSSLAEKLKDAQMQIKRRAGSDSIRWTPIGEIGLLLVSLGEIASSSILRIEGIVAEVAKRHTPMTVSLAGTGGSPNIVMPKVAWFGLTGETDALHALQRDLAMCVQQFVTAIDEKEWEPCVEIGVLRKFDDRARTEMGRSLKMADVGEIGSVTVDAVHVLASHSTSAGPALHSVARISLS